jgi:hypothetical protein
VNKSSVLDSAFGVILPATIINTCFRDLDKPLTLLLSPFRIDHLPGVLPPG